jgi:hypothetical protein
VESMCLRCKQRSMPCGPKLPPQPRPRSITSVPTEYSPPSLRINTQFRPGLLDDDVFGSPSSPNSTRFGKSLPVSPMLSEYGKSLPVSPMIYASQPQLEIPAITPLASPIIKLEQFDTLDSYDSTMGYIHHSQLT